MARRLGWRVTGVDFSATALAHAGSTAEALGSDVAERVEWVEADLGTWVPPPRAYELVVCLPTRCLARVVPKLLGG